MIRVLALAALTAAAPAAAAQTCTTTWQPERIVPPSGDPFFVWTDGDWGDASRWSAGVPDGDDVACVAGPGADASPVNFTVTSSTPRELGGLVVGNGLNLRTIRIVFAAPVTGIQSGRLFGNDSIDGDVTIDGTFEIDNGNLVRGGGTVTVSSQGALTVVQSDGNGGFGNGSQIGDRSAAGSPSLLQLQGRFEAQEAVQVLSVLDVDGGTIATRFDDRGTTVQGVTFWTGGTVRDATFDIDAETPALLGGDFRVSGTLDGVSDGELSFSQDPVTSGGGGLTVEAAGVTFDVGGETGLALRVTQFSNRPDYEVVTEGGEITNTGLLRFPTSERILRGVTLRSTGTVRVEGSGQLVLADAAEVVVEDGSTLTLSDVAGQGNRVVRGASDDGLTGGRVVVRGRLVEAGNGVADAISAPVEVEGGTLEATSGVLTLSGGGRLADAAFAVAAETVLGFQRDWTLAGTIGGSAAGTARFGGTFTDSTRVRLDGDVTLDVGGEGLGFERFSTSSDPTVLEAGAGDTVRNRGRVRVGSGTILRSLPFVNDGDLDLSGQPRLEGGTVVTNAAGGTARFTNVTLNTTDDPVGEIVNEGLAVVGGTSFTQFRGRLVGRPGSEIRADFAGGGFVVFQPDDAQAFDDPAITLSGRGTFSFDPADVVLPGIVSPGSPQTPADTLTSTFFQFAPTGRLVVDLGPEATDFLSTQNRFELDGTLEVRLPEGYAPPVGTEWVIGRFNSSTTTPVGAFSAVETSVPGAAFAVDTSRPGELVVRLTAPVSGEDAPAPLAALELGAPFPNPTRGAATVRVGLADAGALRVRVLDLLGRELAVLADGDAAAGWHEVAWTGAAAGVYVVEARAGAEVRHQRLTVVR